MYAIWQGLLCNIWSTRPYVQLININKLGWALSTAWLFNLITTRRSSFSRQTISGPHFGHFIASSSRFILLLSLASSEAFKHVTRLHCNFFVTPTFVTLLYDIIQFSSTSIHSKISEPISSFSFAGGRFMKGLRLSAKAIKCNIVQHVDSLFSQFVFVNHEP
jgi:hypothetical protein